jgi:hypothetical protein
VLFAVPAREGSPTGNSADIPVTRHSAAGRRLTWQATEKDSVKPVHGLEEPKRAVRYKEAIHRLGEAADRAARHMQVEPDPHDYDDAGFCRKPGTGMRK